MAANEVRLERSATVSCEIGVLSKNVCIAEETIETDKTCNYDHMVTKCIGQIRGT